MKILKTTVIAVLFLSFAGCTYSNSFSTGKNFDSALVQNIQKNTTTKAELIRMLGEPFSKTTLSEDSEKWIYTYSSGAASAQAFTMKTKVDGTSKTLDVLLKNDVVVNFTYSEKPMTDLYNPTK